MNEQIRLRIDKGLVTEATAAEDNALAEIAADRKAGKLVAFTGKL